MRRVLALIALLALAPAPLADAAPARAKKVAKAKKHQRLKARRARAVSFSLPAAATAPQRAPLAGSLLAPLAETVQQVLHPVTETVEPVLAPIPVATSVGVTAREFSLVLSRTAMTAGTRTIQLANRGEDPHDLRVAPVDGQGGGGDVGVAAPGATRTASLTLHPGDYYLFCTLVDGIDHESAGMRATLAVT